MSPSLPSSHAAAPPSSPVKAKRIPKRVRFPSGDDALLVRGVITIPHRDDYTPEEVESLYFSRDEYQACRSAAKAASWECERSGQGKCLDGTFSEKDSDVQERLNSWVASSAEAGCAADGAPQPSSSSCCCRRGLERWSNSDHGEIRNHAQFHAIMAVLRAQDDQLLRRKELDWDKLRKVSCKVTKTSRHFARMIGKADSYAVWQDLKLQQQQQHVSGESSTSIALSSEHSFKQQEQEHEQDAADVSLQGLSLEQDDAVDGASLEHEDASASLASIATNHEELLRPADVQEKATAPNNARVGGRLFSFKRRKEALASRVA